MFKGQIIGNLGTDAELRVHNENKFISFKVANSEKYTAKDGTEHETLQWISVTWNGDGGKLLQYLKKGVKVYVTGSLTVGTYSSPKERRILPDINLRADYIELCGGSSDEIPRRIVDANGVLHDVFKAYYISLKDIPEKGNLQMMGEKSGLYNVDQYGFVHAVKPEQQKADAQQTQDPATEEAQQAQEPAKEETSSKPKTAKK